MTTVVIAGGSGFLGRALTSRLAREHKIVVLTRDAAQVSAIEARHRRPGGPADRVRAAEWTPDGTAGAWGSELEGVHAVVNLAGSGIDQKRWTPARKQELVDSRLKSTASLVEAVRHSTAPAKVFIQQSAIGYYGGFDDGPALDELAPPGRDFLADLCVRWEALAHPVDAVGTRLVTVRTGIPLSKHGGALKKMMLPYKFFVGGPIGSGRQQLSWIHLEDWTGLVAWAIRTSLVVGPINGTAPNPVPHWEFSRALGRAMRRPSWAPVPGFVLRAVIGEMADVALLRGQRVIPARAQELGFSFRYREIKPALEGIFEKRTTSS